MDNDDEEFNVIVYHAGLLSEEPVGYVGGKMEKISNIDIDKWSFQELKGIMTDLKYEDDLKFYWHPHGQNQVIQIESDRSAMDMGLASLKCEGKTAIVYVKHGAKSPIESDFMEEENDSDEEEDYHPIAESDSAPDNDEFDKYTDLGVNDEVQLLSSEQLTGNKKDRNIDKGKQVVVEGDGSGLVDEAGYESDGIGDDQPNSDNEAEFHMHRVKYNSNMMGKDFKFEVGMEFSNVKEFKDAVREWNVLHGRCMKYKKNDRKRVRAICKDPTCEWLVFLSMVQNTRTYLVKTVNMTHTCQFVFNNRSANTSWVAKTIMDDVSRDPKYKLKAIIQKIGKDSNLGISLCKAQRAKKMALNALAGRHDEQYARLWSYLEEIKRACIGNSCRLGVSPVSWSHRPQFDRLYVCLEACKLGFMAGCRPFIGVDGCFLTGDYGGQLLTAVGIDPNNQYFPIAWAIVQVENTDNWRWFLNMLLDDIGPVSVHKWVFMSDQQKGLLKVFDELLDGMEHRFCLRHMYSNFRKKWPGGEYRMLIEAAARAPYRLLFDRKMEEVKRLNVDAYNWLSAIPRSAWCRHAFSCHVQCDALLNNACESFNGRILAGRDQGPIGLLEFIRSYVMDRFVANKLNIERYTGNIMPKIKKKIEVNIVRSADWIGRAAGNEQWEISNAYGSRHVVDLSKHTCSCCYFQLCGIPCEHAVKAIHCKGGSIENYVSRMYSKDAYMACYSPAMSPLLGKDMWPQTAYPDPLPPPFKRKPGRPKKLRRRDPCEIDDTNRRKLSKRAMLGRCRRCGEVGHNRRTCKYPNSASPDEND